MLILGGILLLALILRLWGIKYGLPFAYQIDEERVYVRKAARMLDAGSLNPHYMHNPPLLTYLLESAFAIQHGGSEAHRLIGDVPDRAGLFPPAAVRGALRGTLPGGQRYPPARPPLHPLPRPRPPLPLAALFRPLFHAHVRFANGAGPA